MPINICLVQDSENTELERLLRENGQISLMQSVRSEESYNIPEVTIGNIPSVIVIINLDAVEASTAADIGINLRNEGQQVVIANAVDYGDLLELVSDINRFFSSERDKDRAIKTELLVTENSLNLLNDSEEQDGD